MERVNPEKPFVVVVWNDAWQTNSQDEAGDITHKPLRMHTWGWLLRSDETGITTACEWLPESNLYRDRTFIPRGMVVQEILLEPRKKWSKKDKSTKETTPTPPSTS